MKITVRTLRMGWSAVVDVPDKCLVGELRQEAAKAADMTAARTKLILRGAALQDDKQIAPIKPGDTVLLASAPEAPPRPPPGATRSGSGAGAGTSDGEGEEGDDLPRIDRSRLTPTQLKVVRFLQFTCHVPEPVIHGVGVVMQSFELG